MRKWKRGLALLLAGAMVFGSTSMLSYASQIDGNWEKKADGWYYRDTDGDYVLDEILEFMDSNNQIKEMYYVDDDGKMVTKELIWDEDEDGYYAGSSGVFVKNQWR